jgi:hypothetical protein
MKNEMKFKEKINFKKKKIILKRNYIGIEIEIAIEMKI